MTSGQTTNRRGVRGAGLTVGLAAALALTGPGRAVGAGGAVETVAGGAPFEVHPHAAAQDGARQTITVSYRARNVGAETGEFAPRVTLPAGWRLLLPPASLALRPGEEDTGLFVVLPGERTEAGEYRVTLTDRGGHETGVTVRVVAQPRLSVAVAQAPTVVVGEPYTILFTVANGGNVAQDVRLSTSNSAALPLRLTPPSAHLAPGERAEVAVRVLVPPGLPASQTVYVQLLAQGRSEGGASAVTEVLPGQVPRSATHVTLPLTVSAGTGAGPGQETTWRVVGETRLPGDVRVALDLGDTSPWVAVERGPLAVSAGRQWYGQTPPGDDTPAPGVRARYRSESWAAEGNVFRAPNPASAPNAPASLTFGVGLGWEPWPGAALALDLRRGQGGLGWAAHARVAGTPGEVARGRWWQAQADARGGPDLWQASASTGFGVRGAGALLAFEREMTGDGDTWRVSAGGTWAPRPPLTLGVRAALSRTPEQLSAQTELGVTLASLGEWGAATLNYVYRSAPDTNGAADPRHHHAGLRTETYWPLHSTHELVVDAGPGVHLGYGGTLDVPTNVGTFGGTVRATYEVGTGVGTLGGGLGWEGILGDRTTLGLQVGTDDVRGGRWQLQGSAAHLLPSGGQLSAAAGLGFGGAGGPPGLTFKVGASWPLEVPLAVRRDVGSMTGRVSDETGRPVADLLLRLGSLAARTDAEGGYTFAAVPPGPHYLTADAASLGAGRLALPALPARVEVPRGGTVRQDLRLVRPATVVGTVRLEGPATAPDTTAGLLLELRGEGGEVLRALTEEGGSFAFSGLAPGSWTLALADGPLGRTSPRLSGYVAQVPTTPLQLGSGERTTVTLALTSRSRTVNVQNGGSLTPLPATPPRP